MAVTRLSIGTGFLNARVAFASRAESRNPRRVAAPDFGLKGEVQPLRSLSATAAQSHIASNVKTSAAAPRATRCLFQHRRKDLHLARDGSRVEGCEAKQESAQRRSSEDEPIERQRLHTARAGG